MYSYSYWEISSTEYATNVMKNVLSNKNGLPNVDVSVAEENFKEEL